MSDKSMGQRAFEAYNEAKGGRTYDGKPIPPWDAVGDDVRSAWERAAAVVVIATLRERDERDRGRGALSAEHDVAKAQCERDEARAQLAALHAAGRAASETIGDAQQQLCGTTRADADGILRVVAGAVALEATLRDLATAAAEHDARVRAAVAARALNMAAEIKLSGER